VGPFGKELAPFTMTDQLLSVSYCGWPVKTSSESFSDQCFRGGVVATGSSVYVFQQLEAIVLSYAFQ